MRLREWKCCFRNDSIEIQRNFVQAKVVNNEIMMFLMIKRVSKRLLERSEQQNWFYGFQIMCKDEIFKEIGGRNQLNFVNNEILMFLMKKQSQNTC